MTRKEQIIKAAEERKPDRHDEMGYHHFFRWGAEWADKNPYSEAQKFSDKLKEEADSNLKENGFKK